MRNFLLIFVVLTSIGATSMHSTNSGKFEVSLDILSTKELESKNAILDDTVPDGMYYLYGWIRLKEFPKNAWSFIPRCKLIVKNSQMSLTFKVLDIDEEKQYILIPLGKALKDKTFKVRVK